LKLLPTLCALRKQMAEDPESGTNSYLEFRQQLDQWRADTEGCESQAETYKKQGNQFFSFGCYSQASACYGMAIELSPKNAVLFSNRAMAYLKQEMGDEALADAIRSISLDPTQVNIKAYWRKSQALLDLGRPEEAEAVTDEGLVLEPNNGHLNRVRRKAREACVVKQLSACKWVGKLDNGIQQGLVFDAAGKMTMIVMGQKVSATYDLSVEGKPRSMVVKMSMDGGMPGMPPAPPVPYIFEFNGDELWLCHPVSSPELPSKFEGPGFVRMRPDLTVDVSASSTEPLEKRVADYLRSMNNLMPELPPQLPAKPSDQEISQEVLMTDRMATLKRQAGLEVHRRAVELAKNPELAPDVPSKELAQAFRKRLVARLVISESTAGTAAAPLQAKTVAAEPVVSAPVIASRDVEMNTPHSTDYQPSTPDPEPSGCWATQFGQLILMICDASARRK